MRSYEEEDTCMSYEEGHIAVGEKVIMLCNAGYEFAPMMM